MLSRVLDREWEFLGPARPHTRRVSHRIAGAADVGERVLQSSRDAIFVNRDAPEVDDLGDVLNMNWTDLHAGAARRAGPYRLICDCRGGEESHSAIGPDRVAKIHDQGFGA